jgi:hypothetical protein
MRIAAEKRVYGILDNSRRQHYGHAALLVARRRCSQEPRGLLVGLLRQPSCEESRRPESPSQHSAASRRRRSPTRFRVHAIQRMFRRGVSVEAIRQVLATGETIERYPDDTPYPSRLVLGWRESRSLPRGICRKQGDARDNRGNRLRFGSDTVAKRSAAEEVRRSGPGSERKGPLDRAPAG